MNVIARPADTGKTKELLLMAEKDKALVFAENKDDLQAKANAYGIIAQVIDWDDIMNNDYGENTPIYIHRMDEVMKHYFEEGYGLELKGYSIRLED